MISKIIIVLYKYKISMLRNILLRIIEIYERGSIYSKTMRHIYSLYHDVEVGMYTQGAFSSSCTIDRKTKIGRYCSISMNVRIMNRNHPMEFKSTHAFFFNPFFGICYEDKVEYIPLDVGNDVWVGHGAIFHPHVRKVGDGAVIGAGAVVTKDVPPYAVVVGNPARVVRYRFNKEIIDELLASRWWEKSIEELKPHIHEFQHFKGDSNLGRQEGSE